MPIAGRNNQHISDEWLEHRFNLFENWLLPSLKAQTVQDFTWIAFMDNRVPIHFKMRGRDLEDDYPNLNFLYLQYQDWAQMEQEWFWNIRALAEPGLVHTSRIDTDDAVRKDYIELIQKHAKVGYFTCFRNGYMSYDNEAYPRNYVKNPFLTFSEEVDNTDDLQTVNKVPHPKADPMHYIRPDLHGWIQQAHDKNLFNHDTINYEAPTIPLDSIRKEFGI
jgi:hypothetical protein